MAIITRYLLVVIVAIVFIFAHLVPCLAFASQSFDLKPIEIKYLQQVHLDVAGDAVNRINFDNFRVVKLIGNISSGTYVLSDQGSDLFIAPKLPAGKKIDFSALLSSGDIIDFSLNIVKSSTPYLVKLSFPKGLLENNKSEAAAMIEAMHSGRIGKYYVEKSLKKVNIQESPDIKAFAQDSYRFGNLRGIILVLENLSRSRSVAVTASDFTKSFDRVTAIYIQQPLLPVKGKTKAYIIFKEPVT